MSTGDMTALPSPGVLALLLLFGAGFFAGIVDAIAGGGGLISLPMLLNLGFPPQMALGTSKLQGTFGSVTATVHFARGGIVAWRDCFYGWAWTSAGALAGVWCVQSMDTTVLGKIIPGLLGVILVYVLLKPEIGKERREPRTTHAVFFALAGLGLGFYDGFFGPGVGSFWTMALIVFLGLDFVHAAGHARAMNASSNLVALAFFAWKGLVAWKVGLVMAAGQLLGSRVGAKLAMKRGSRFVKPLFLTMVCLTLTRLVWVNYLK